MSHLRGEGAMVDFRKRLGVGSGKQSSNPTEIYERLDRASDKGPLRPAQEAVLLEWAAKHRAAKDVIVKLHTGQGKTVIGLLILQSKLNEGAGPALYLCPDNYLVEQTAQEAKKFGFSVCTARGEDLPAAFLDSKAILIASVQKLFNGQTKFGLGARSVRIGALVIDDAHACIDSIRDACSIKLTKGSQAYGDLVSLFGRALESQGSGTFADLSNGQYDALLPVPYWDWIDRTSDVARILARNSASKEIAFAWPLVKDMLEDCDCIASGTGLEIRPRIPPLWEFGTYQDAKHRVFMSATISDDSFLTKGMGLAADTVKSPLTYAKEKWWGEKMVLIPSLLSEELSREVAVAHFAKPEPGRKYGVVALTPSYNRTKDWEGYKAVVATKETIGAQVARLHTSDCAAPLVIANRYDGIDLPDNACRILILDSRPYGESLFDRHMERCLSNTEIITVRIARSIEQGMGRSVRGEKDYSVVLLIGADLVRLVRSRESRSYLSTQTQKQIEIGLAVAEYAQEDMEQGKEAVNVLDGLISQCLKRDPGWKDYYVEQMGAITDPGANLTRLDAYALEFKADRAARDGDYRQAARTAQELADKHANSDAEKGWYLQEAARHLFRISKVESEQLQATAHRKNRYLLRPLARPQTDTLKPQRRIDSVLGWIRAHESPAALRMSVQAVLSDLTFGVDADTFEAAVDRLGKALGFACERPDKEWKEGPDNLWRIADNRCLVIECKSEVQLTRAEIEKRETEQMNRSYAWFQKHYPGVDAQCVLVIPPKRLSSAAALLHPTRVLRKKGLENLTKNVRNFFGEFATQDLKSLSEQHISQALNKHGLAVDQLMTSYTEVPAEAGLPIA